MDYAIALFFDKDTESHFNSIIKSIADGKLDVRERTMPSFPPHITLACFSTEAIELIINELDKYALNLKAGDVVWASLGAFVPFALFAAPIMNEYLLNVNIALTRLLEPLAAYGDNGYYLPNQWVPHTTLAVNLGYENLAKAFDIASQQFTAVKGSCNRLLLAECNPYKEVAVWDLL